MLDQDKWREDMPRLVRGSLGRQQRGHWNTTVANAWGVLAMEKFAAEFEKEPVTGVTARQARQAGAQVDWTKQAEGGESDVLLAAGPRRARASRTTAAASPGRWCRASPRSRCKEPFSSGYRIKRTVSAVEQKTQGQVDARRCHARAPGSGSAVRHELGRGQRSGARRRERSSAPAWAATRRSWRAARRSRAGCGPPSKSASSIRFAPTTASCRKASGRSSTRLRLNNPGEFLLPETRVEALYAPEMFGEIPNARVVVGN